MQQKKLFLISTLFLTLAFLIPFEHKLTKAFHNLTTFFYTRSPQLPDIFEKNLFYFFSELAIVLLFTLTIPKKISKPVIFYSLFLAITASSLLFKESFYTSYFSLVHLLIIFLFFIFVSTFDLENNKTLLNIFFILLISAVTFSAIVGIVQFFTSSFIGLRFLGEPTSSFSDPNLITLTIKNKRILRAYGTTHHPNVFAGMLLFSLFISSYLFLLKPKKKILLGIAIFLQISALIFTFSRSALLATLCSGIFFFSLIFYKLPTYSKRAKHLLVLISSSFLIICASFASTLYERGTVPGTDIAKKGHEERLSQYTASAKLLKDHWIRGVGYQNYVYEIEKNGLANPQIKTRPPHNIYLLILTELGIVGLLAWLLYIGSIFYYTYKSSLTLLSLSLFSILIGYLIIGFFDFYPLLDQKAVLLFTLATGLLATHAKKEPYKSLCGIS